MSYEDCEKIYEGEPPLAKRKAKLKMYDNRIVKPMDECTLRCKANDAVHKVKF